VTCGTIDAAGLHAAARRSLADEGSDAPLRAPAAAPEP
jgi:hypothetical protein